MLLFLSAALAAPCDVASLKTEIESGAPIRVARLFTELYACDKVAAEKVSKTAVSRMVAGEGTESAVVAALSLNRAPELGLWLDTLEPDDRSRLIARLGNHCAEGAAVGDFFAASEARIGDRFWKERWYRGLSSCRVPAVAALLERGLARPEYQRDSRDRPQMVSFRKASAPNVGAPAIERIGGWLAAPKDGEEAIQLIGVLADAANVGSGAGADASLSELAASTLENVAPNLPAVAIDRARDVLGSLGAPDRAERISKFRWTDRLTDGAFVYGYASWEVATCKNGKVVGRLYLGEVADPALRWTDVARPALEAAVKTQPLGLAAARACAGTGTTSLEITRAPVLPAERDAFFSEQKKLFEAALGAGKGDVEKPDRLTAR
jgi:hypothetical protein